MKVEKIFLYIFESVNNFFLHVVSKHIKTLFMKMYDTLVISVIITKLGKVTSKHI